MVCRVVVVCGVVVAVVCRVVVVSLSTHWHSVRQPLLSVDQYTAAVGFVCAHSHRGTGLHWRGIVVGFAVVVVWRVVVVAVEVDEET